MPQPVLVPCQPASENKPHSYEIANKNYVPFFRVMDEASFLGGSKGFQGKNQIRRMKGSGRDIIDPLESIIRNTYAYIKGDIQFAIIVLPSGESLSSLRAAGRQPPEQFHFVIALEPVGLGSAARQLRLQKVPASYRWGILPELKSKFLSLSL
ncbi:MAG: hypothetical protein FWE89_04625 [Syntrophaceae bacterium]|nr:hypothetical protein [Syntrophaceae bacterium]